MWCLYSCDEPEIQLVATCKYQPEPTLFARIRVKFLSFVWKRLDSLAMSSFVLGGAVGTVGDSKSPILSSPSSPITSFT